MNVGVAYFGVCVLRLLKEEVSWAIDKWLWVICNLCCLKQLYHYKELKNKTVDNFENIVCVSVWFLLTHSDDFEWNHGSFF